MELLAPAGNMKSFMNAVNNGADAVYLGVGDFNARRKADNFTFETLAEVLKYAHFLGVKVYLTLNTLIGDSEIEKFIKTASECYQMGVDAFIIQDIGMAKLLKENFPEITLHASTQMAISDYESAKFAFENLKVKRVILSRETDFEEIRKISEINGLETEVFVHGALCVSFSGYCYFSALKSGNSGNRGRCLQPCRKCYSVFHNGKELGKGYFLSTKDICLIDKINALKDLNVTSIKIEGRLKRDEYTGGAVRIYRKAIDSKANENDKSVLKRLFNRGGFSEGYVGNVDDLMFNKVQGHYGEFAGKIIKAERNLLFAEFKEEITNGDCFKIISKGFETGSAVSAKKLSNGTYSLIYKGSAKTGDLLHITTDESLLDEINKTPDRVNKVELEFTAFEGEEAVLTAECNGRKVKITSGKTVEKARTQEITDEDIIKSLSKTADFPIKVSSLKIKTGSVFIPKSIVNSMRRNAFESLINECQKPYQKIINGELRFNSREISPDNGEFCREKVIIVSNESQLSDDIIQRSDKIIYYPGKYDFNAAKSFEQCVRAVDCKKELFLNVPCFLRGEDRKLLEDIFNGTKFGGCINSLNFVNFLKRSNKKIFVLNLNVFNEESIGLLEEEKIYNICLSKELSEKQIKTLTDRNGKCKLYLNCYGNTELMQLNHCPSKSDFGGSCDNCNFVETVYSDDFNEKFSVKRNMIKNCYFRLIDNVPLDLRKAVSGIKISEIYNFENYKPEQIKRVLDGEVIEQTSTSIFANGVK